MGVRHVAFVSGERRDNDAGVRRRLVVRDDSFVSGVNSVLLVGGILRLHVEKRPTDAFHEHLSFGVLAQTFWCGAIVAPVAVYTVRAFAAGIVTALLGYSAMAFSAEPPVNEEGQRGVSMETIMATAWLAFILGRV